MNGQLDKCRELLVTYEQSITRKDQIIASLNQAIRKQACVAIYVVLCTTCHTVLHTVCVILFDFFCCNQSFAARKGESPEITVPMEAASHG